MSQPQPETPTLNHPLVQQLINKCDLTLGRKIDNIYEIAEVINETKQNIGQCINFYEKTIRDLMLKMVETTKWAEAYDKLVKEIQTKVDFPIVLPERPEFIKIKENLPGKPAETQAGPVTMESHKTEPK